MTSVVALPIYQILVCTLSPQVEYKNNTWKQVLTSPQTKMNIFLAKFINIQLLIGLFLVTNLLFMIIGAVILHFIEPSLHVLNQPLHWDDILMSRVSAYVALLAMCAIQYWLGLKFKNFIVPIAIGIALWFTGTILVMQVKSGLVAYFPYSFHAYGKFPVDKPELIHSIGWTSLAYAVLFLCIGYFDFRNRQMKL